MSSVTNELLEFKRFLDERIAAGDVKTVKDVIWKWGLHDATTEMVSEEEHDATVGEIREALREIERGEGIEMHVVMEKMRKIIAGH
ncbi:MAG: hypothetical protein QM811_27230 [Pirellulales bacterium]